MADEETIEVDAPPPEESSNRTFIVLAILLGGIFLAGLLCIGAYAVLIGPRAAAQRQTQLAVVNATNTQIVAQNSQVAADMTQVNIDATATQEVVDATATELAVEPTATASGSPTPVVRASSTNTPPF